MRIHSDPFYLNHDTGAHPERPERLTEVLTYLQRTPLGELVTIQPEAARDASKEDLLLVHAQAHVDRVTEVCRKGGGSLDPDTRVCPISERVARRAIGALLTAVDEAQEGTTRQSLVLSRPPGHHATTSQSMGFCLYNHVAVAARHLRRRHGVPRVAVLDFDAHHGNGTQEIFYEDPSVLYLSIHRAPPFYPGTGKVEERGGGPGTGTTLNFPIPGPPYPVDPTGLFLDESEKALLSFRPEFILVSAGFDGYIDDPVAGLEMKTTDFEIIGRRLRRLAEHHCQGRIVSVLEGGYSLRGLPLCVEAYVHGMIHEERE